MKYQMARQGWNDAPQTLLSIAEIQELCPVINTSKVKQIRMSQSIEYNWTGVDIHAKILYTYIPQKFEDPGWSIHTR